jgi:general secretion pathway protein F
MQSFSYKAYRSNGELKRGTIEAETSAAATQLLKTQGFRALELLPQSDGAGPSVDFSGWRSARQVDFARFFADLAVLMNAGLSFDRALKAMSANNSERSIRQLADNLSQRLSSGRSPSQALAQTKGLRADVVALVASGEQSGRLARVFSILAADSELQQSQRKLIVEALIYPAFLFVVMIGALLVITFVLVPAIEPIFESSGREAPFVFRAFSTVGQAIVSLGSVLPFVLLLALVAIVWTSKRPQMQKGLSRAVLVLPVVGSLVRKVGLARYLQSLALLLENGVEMPSSLALAAATCPVRSFEVPLSQVRDMVVSGKRLPDAFADVGIFPPATVSLAAIGDEVNKLPSVLDNASSILRSEVKRRIDRLLVLLTPVITIVMGGLVGSLVVSVMTALLSINEIGVQ